MAVKTFSYVFEDLAVILEVVVIHDAFEGWFSHFRHVCLAL